MSGKYSPYPDYQDTGLDWLGRIPKSWEIRRLGSFFQERRTKVSDKDYSALSVTMQGIVPQLETAAKTDAGDNRKLVRAGDFVINSRSDRKGSSGVSPHDGSVSLISIVLEPFGIHPPFAHHLLRSRAFQEEFYRFGKGIVADLWSTNYTAMKNILIPEMSRQEQTQIAKFLDYETGKIDRLIEKQEALIALLKEKRQAVISHAVTKGLNPAAPMRDSGVQWLGEVPAHWEVKRLGHLGYLQNGLNIGGDAFGSGYPFVSYGDVYNNAIVPQTPTGLVKSSADDHSRYDLQRGDVLFTRTSETVDDIGVASTCLQEIPKVTFAGFLIRFRPLFGVLNPSYSSFLFRNQIIQDSFAGNMNLVTRASLSQNLLKNLQIGVPPINEQGQIAKYLSKITPVFDELEASLIAQAELLKERRTALISAAVTGKIDVRGWQPPHPHSESHSQSHPQPEAT